MIKKLIWKLRKKWIRSIKIMRGASYPMGCIGLSPEEAESVYGSRSDIEIKTYFRASEGTPALPEHLPEDDRFEFNLSVFPKKYPACDLVMLDAKNDQFTFQHQHLFDDQHRVVYEPNIGLEQLAVQHEFLVDCKKVKGTVAYLGNTLFCQYGHWIQRQLVSLVAYWEHVGKDNIDYYYIGDGNPPAYVIESLLKFGIRKDQILSEPCRGDRSLIVVKNASNEPVEGARFGFRMSEAAHKFLTKNLFKAEEPVAGKRLFIQRGNVSGRKELNAKEIEKALVPLGFEFTTTQGMTMQHEADLFGNADVIVAVHGAALHNLLFAKPGTLVIEIFPYDYFEESNYMIASLGGCKYFYLIGDSIGQSFDGVDLLRRNRADVQVDTAKLLRLLELAGISA